MKRYKKPLMIAGAFSSLAFASVTGVGLTSAATSGSDGSSGLIDKIATKFNLNKDEVKAVFEEERTAREAEMKAKMEERLSKAVTDGKITEEQKQKIITKLAELKSEREANKDSMKDKTDEERKAAMEAKKSEIEKWASDNGIPVEYLRIGGGHGGPGGPRPR